MSKAKRYQPFTLAISIYIYIYRVLIINVFFNFIILKFDKFKQKKF